MSYSHILVAIGPLDEGEVLLGRARVLSQRLDARLSVLHVIEPVPPLAGLGLAGGAGLAPGVDDLAINQQLVIGDAMMLDARRQLEALAAKFGVAPSDLRIGVGAHAAEILATAADVSADLVVVGHHPHHGWSALFSHTEESVVHRAQCDVLAVALGA